MLLFQWARIMLPHHRCHGQGLAMILLPATRYCRAVTGMYSRRARTPNHAVTMAVPSATRCAVHLLRTARHVAQPNCKHTPWQQQTCEQQQGVFAEPRRKHKISCQDVLVKSVYCATCTCCDSRDMHLLSPVLLSCTIRQALPVALFDGQNRKGAHTSCIRTYVLCHSTVYGIQYWQ